MGINAEGLGRDHWNEMLAYPRKPIAHWHSLVEVKKSFKEVGEVALGPWHVCCMAARAREWQSAAARPRLCGSLVGVEVAGCGEAHAFHPECNRQEGNGGRQWEPA